MAMEPAPECDPRRAVNCRRARARPWLPIIILFTVSRHDVTVDREALSATPRRALADSGAGECCFRCRDSGLVSFPLSMWTITVVSRDFT